MGLFATLRQKASQVLYPVDNRTSWWSVIRESFTGAWQRNVEVRRENVLTYWAVYACIRLIANDIAKMRVKLMEQAEDGLWREVKNSPFLRVLQKPNRYQTRVQFWVYWICSLLIHGNTYALKQRDSRGVVTALYILDPCRVKVLVATDGSVFYQLQADNLSGVEEMLDVTVPASEILHDRINCLFHPLIGISPLFASGLAATQGLAIQNNSANFFENGSMPGGIIKVPGALDPDQAAILKASWTSGYTGTNRGKTAVLADKMEYQQLTINAVDSQMIEQLKMTAQMVCSTFGVPAYKVGVEAIPSGMNVAAAEQAYYAQCLQGIIEGTELVLDEGLGLDTIRGKTMGTEFNIEDLIRMDPMAQMDFVEKGVKSAVLSPNEARARFDLSPKTGGESPYLQQQNFSIAALAKRDAQDDPFGTKPAPAPTVPALPAPDDEAEQQELAFISVIEREFSEDMTHA